VCMSLHAIASRGERAASCISVKIPAMPKRDPILEALNRLSRLRSAPDDATLHGEMRGFLRNRSNLVIAKAAKTISERGILALVPDLVAAFHKLMGDPAWLDKRCEATTEIASALYTMDYLEPEIYLVGLHHVQMEGSYGPPVDAAAQLRGVCAQGLTRTRYPHALEEVVSLLVDSEPPARIGAVRALAANGGTGGLLALRLKTLTGDREAAVIAECFAGLLASPSEEAVNFVARYVDSHDAPIAEAAVLALGATRSAKAVEVLKRKWEKTRRGPLKGVVLLALASSRSQEALNFLLEQLETALVSAASEILTALAVQRPSVSIRQSIEAAIERRDDDALRNAYNSAFPG
jgi:hypothetical protein